MFISFIVILVIFIESYIRVIFVIYFIIFNCYFLESISGESISLMNGYIGRIIFKKYCVIMVDLEKILRYIDYFFKIKIFLGVYVMDGCIDGWINGEKKEGRKEGNKKGKRKGRKDFRRVFVVIIVGDFVLILEYMICYLLYLWLRKV